MGPGDRGSEHSSSLPVTTDPLPERTVLLPREPHVSDLSPLNRKDMDRLVMNYLQTEGFREAAEHFKNEAGIEMSPKIGNMDERIRIKSSIQTGNISEAKELINNLHPELLDENFRLHFRLLQQELIEVIRSGDVEKSLSFAQTHLSEIGEEHPELLPEIENAMALLAFDSPESTPFGDLMLPNHREKVASEVNSAILEFENRADSDPKISTLLKTILWLQSELDAKKFKYPKLVRFGESELEVVSPGNENA